MNRRGFLQLASAATIITAAGITLIDTAKTFFLPPAGGWRKDWTLTPDMEEVCMVQRPGMNLGETIYVRIPPRYGSYWATRLGTKT